MAETKFAATVVKIDGVTVAKVTNFRRSIDNPEIDVTGSEDTQKQFVAALPGETIHLEGITVDGSGEEYDAGQQDIVDAAKAQTSVVVQSLKASGYGANYTGIFTSFEDGGSVDDVYKWSGDFRVNTYAAVTP